MSNDGILFRLPIGWLTQLFRKTPPPIPALAKPVDSARAVLHHGKEGNGMDVKDEIIGAILGHEGGYVNNPDDSGGETNWGITKAVARQYGYKGSMRHMTKRVAIAIYEELYWHPLLLDEISRHSHSLAYVLFDIGVNAGVGRSARYFQRCLNVLNNRGRNWPDIVADGEIGGKTMAAFRSFYGMRGAEGITRLIAMIKGLQMAHYITLAERREKDEAFIYGWAGRAAHMPNIANV